MNICVANWGKRYKTNLLANLGNNFVCALASPCNNLNTLTVGYHTPVFGLNRIKVTAFYVIMFSKRW